MKPIRWKIYFSLCLLMVSVLTACRTTAPGPRRPLPGPIPPTVFSSDHQLVVFFIRHATYAGGGRTHNLKIDNRAMGRLTADNYYQLTMWSGEYHFSVELPREEFFGQVSAPVTVGRQITLAPHPAGNTYLCEYTDGMGSSGFSVKRLTDARATIQGRTLAGSFSASDTAQVTRLFEARYDGPALNGQPHGEGTLTWPDGSVYYGTIEHGVPTRRARFIYPTGDIYMGPNRRGRPRGPGLLMSSQGRILFAGDFVEEKPSGKGIRDGAKGPEFCIFIDGRDLTKTFRQLAKETLDLQDREQIRTRPDPEADIQAKIHFQKTRLTQMADRHDPDAVRDAYAKTRREIDALEKSRIRIGRTKEAATKEFISQLRASRYEREIAKTKAIGKSHQARIEKERQWCRDETDLGRNLCTCAPLADDFHTWQECWEPTRPRYIE